MRGRAGYAKGMNKDNSPAKRDPQTYFDLKNFRVITEDGLSTGALVNESSTVARFKFPDLEEMTLTDGTVIPAQADLKIVGWTTIIDTIVVFTTNDTSEEPSSYGQIWALKFNEVTETVIDINGDTLDPDIHLKYNQALNFSTWHRIGRAVGRYENVNTQRVYWTDNHNPVSVFNIAIEDSLNVPLDNITLAPNVHLTQPVIEEVGSGSLPVRTMVQLCYRLKTTDGAETIVSPLSKLYPLTETLPYSTNWVPWLEDQADSSAANSRSITYNIKGLDTDWDVVEHLIVVYTDKDVFTVYSFAEEAMPSTGDLTVTCSDISTAVTIPNVEFNMLQSGFDVCKDIVVDQNRLVAANTKTNKFSVDYDARAYRFNSAQEGLITDPNTGDVTIDGAAPDYDIADTHDAINPYNNENDADWDTDAQYKFKADGVTVGGDGPNVSYEFVDYHSAANQSWNETNATAPPHANVTPWGDAITPRTNGVLDSYGNLMEFNRASQLRNMSAPYAVSTFRGYARGEVYRFGIVFYDNKGSTSYVNWIGDIRMPEPIEGFPIMQNVGSYPYMRNLGIKFTVDTSSIQDQISGYSIVRVRRDPEDRTRLGTGMIMWWDIHELDSSLIHSWEAGPDPVNSNDPWPMTHAVDIGGGTGIAYHLPDRPGWNDPQLGFSTARKVAFMMGPLGQTIDYDHKDEDFLKAYAYYSAPAVQYTTSPDSGSDNNKAYGFSYKVDGYFPLDHPAERLQIEAARRLRIGEYLYTGTDIIDGFTGANGLMNATATRDPSGIADGIPEVSTPLGLGNPKIATMLGSGSQVTIVNGTDAANGQSYLGGNFHQVLSFQNDGDVTDQEAIFKEVAMCRYLDGQYGGDSYEARSQNQYISTGHYQVITADVGSTVSPEVYGGDVFVNYLDDEYAEQYWDTDAPFGGIYEDPYADNKLSLVACFPTESVVNQDYRRSTRWLWNRDGDNMGAYQSNTYGYPAVFSQEEIAQEKFFAEDFLTNTVEEHPHQLWASQPKIDGEFTDSWRIFQVNDSIEVTGVYGPINRIMSFNDKVYFYQNSAVGITTIDQRVVLSDQDGQELALGTGGVFPDYQYISTTTGAFHQFGVTNTERHLYHWDTRLKKIYRVSGREVVPISDLKGMSSFFHNLEGEFLDTDLTLRSPAQGGPAGVHASADYRYNRVLFTFSGTKRKYNVSELLNANGYTFITGTLVFQGATLYYVTEGFSVPDVGQEPNLAQYNQLTQVKGTDLGFTISYNELMDAFESFYDFVPNIYLQYGRRLLSTTPLTLDEVWEHNTSDSRCSFYEETYPSILETVLAEQANLTKTFDNFQYHGTVTNSSGADVEESFTKARVHNEFQDTGILSLDGILHRHQRLWRLNNPRDQNDSLERIRAPWTKLYLEHDNLNNYRHTVKDIEYAFRPSKN